MKEEKYNEAIACYTKAMELDSANAVFPCNRYIGFVLSVTHHSDWFGKSMLTCN